MWHDGEMLSRGTRKGGMHQPAPNTAPGQAVRYLGVYDDEPARRSLVHKLCDRVVL